MDVPYICVNSERLTDIVNRTALNAIDYLEVVDSDAPPDSPRQQTLLVHCVRPVAGLTAGNIVIDGGERITGIEAVWAYPASSISVPPATNDEHALWSGLANAPNVLVVRTNAAGDFSTYTLRLVTSATDATPPPGFDAVLSRVDFSFKVECPSSFDCLSTLPCAEPSRSGPPLSYLAKDYTSFRQAILDRLAVTLPAWQEQHPADLGIALVELLAYAADQLSYYQDAVATEAYLGTARERISVRRHARLLDYRMHDGSNARTWIFFEAAGGVSQTLKAQSVQLLTRNSAPPGVLSQAQADLATRQGAQVFETLQDVTISDAHNLMKFYTWDGKQCCLPAGAMRATLNNSSNAIALAAGDALVFEEVISPQTGFDKDADPAHRWAVRLTSAVPGTDPVTSTPIVEINWMQDDALPFPLCLSVLLPGATAPIEDLCVARGNIALADNGLTIANEPLLPVEVVPGKRYRPVLQQAGVTSSVAYDSAAASAPASTLLTQDPRAALPVISLSGPTGDWVSRRDLLESAPNALDFVAESDRAGSVHLRFGDGVLGAEPVSGLTATYRFGNGAQGNVGADAITNFLGASGVVSVRNPLAAAGGVDPEAISDVQQYAPQAFRVQERAVTEADYAEVTMRHPEVQRAVGTLRWTGSWYTMFVSVERTLGNPVDANFRETIREFLEQFRLAGYDLEIQGPKFVALDIAFEVCVASGYFRSNVEQDLLAAFSNRIQPDGSKGFFHPDNFTFGQPVYLSQVVAVAMKVPGVFWVDTNDTPPSNNRFKRWGEVSHGETAAGMISMGPLEIARLSNDPSEQENGRIEFYLDGGL
jgi:hypothetical protein